MSNLRNEDDFYQQGFQLIYNWLTEEEKIDYNIELLNEYSKETDKMWRNKFYRILRYIEVKHVNLQKYTQGLFENFSILNKEHSHNEINDIMLQSEPKLSMRLLNNKYVEENVMKLFINMLKDILAAPPV